MAEHALTVIGAMLVNNLVLAQFLGLCPMLGASRGLQTAMHMALATASILIVSATANQLLYAYLLQPFGFEYLRTLAFFAAIAAITSLLTRSLRKINPALHGAFAGLTPLMAVNSAALGVALLNVQASRGFLASMLYALGGACGISLVLILLTAMRERIAAADAPEPFRGSATDLITLGLMSLAFLGFAGLTKS